MIITYLWASLTMLLAFACVITYHYVVDLRAENKRLHEIVDALPKIYYANQSFVGGTSGLDAALKNETPLQSGPLPFSGIGITQIRDRELRAQRERDAETQPRFDRDTLARQVKVKS